VVAGTECFGTAGRLVLSPVADWLRSPSLRSGTARLEPVWRTEVERLVPSTGRLRGYPAAALRANVDAWQRHRFFEGLARALVVGGRPTLLVLDNLHWCDQETLEFVSFCVGLVAEAPLLIAATARDDDNPVLAGWTARMRTAGLLDEVALGPLEVADTARLVEAITGRPTPADTAELVQATTGGFPLYVIEAARSAVDHAAAPPPTGDLTRVLVKRLEQLGPAAREVAGLAAAVGRNFTLDLLTEASDLDPGSVVRAVDELWRRRIMRGTGDGYDFSHDLLRDAAYAQVSPPGRWLLHRRLAQGLELLHADDPDAVSVQLAEQYYRGGRPERAVEHYRRAADIAAGMFAHGEAIRLLAEALAIVRRLPEGRDRNRHELAVLEAMAAPLNAHNGYSSPDLRQTLERSVDLADALGRRQSLVNGLVGLWSSLFVQGHTASAHRMAERALALVDPRSALSGPAHFAFGGSAVSLGRPAEALRHLELVALLGGTHLVSVGTRPDVHGTAWAAHAHWLLGDDAAALASSGNAVALARTTGSPYVLAVALAYGAITHQLRGDLPTLRRTVDELCTLCARHGFAYYREWATILDGWAHAGEGGVTSAQRGVAHLTAEGSFARMPYWLSLVADLLARTAQPEAARAALDAAVVAARAHDDLWWLPNVLRMRAAYDDPPSAAARLRSAARLAAEQGSVALLRRCEDDLTARGVPVEPPGGLEPRHNAAPGNVPRTPSS
jgi:tetratricopeptide (TPR) repeat protein